MLRPQLLPAQVARLNPEQRRLYARWEWLRNEAGLLAEWLALRIGDVEAHGRRLILVEREQLRIKQQLNNQERFTV